MDLYLVDKHFTLNRWMPQLALREDITILFRPEEHLSHWARNGEGRTPPGTGRAPHKEWRALISVSPFQIKFICSFLSDAVHTFLSRGNPTEVLKWWGRLNSTTRFFVEAASFKHFVETQPIERAKKSILCALAERWWDTTHTFHIASVEMTITPYGVYRLTGLRVDGIVPTFSAFPAEAPQTTIEEATWMARAFLLYLIGTTLDCNTSQTIPVRTHQMKRLQEFFDGLTPEQRAGIPMLDRLDEVGDFKEYQQSLMPTLFPPPVAPADVPSTSGAVPAYPMGLVDIILPSRSVPLYQADSSLRETVITRHTDVLGYPVPADAYAISHPCGPELYVPAVWEHEDHDDGPVSRPLF
uniref:Aminotransferase-like plant mobile domain-containing protein n=1 Tax=Fagus sylvatica TaxID=28930 RepID=A0A2N9IQ68_FAGSY